MWHAVRSTQGAKLLTIFSPGGFDSYLEELVVLTEGQCGDAAFMRELSENTTSSNNDRMIRPLAVRSQAHRQNDRGGTADRGSSICSQYRGIGSIALAPMRLYGAQGRLVSMAMYGSPFSSGNESP